MGNWEKIKQLWEAYDEASNKETDFYLKYLDALRQGKRSLADYIDKNVLPKLKKKTCQLFLIYSREVEKLNEK